MLTLKKDEIRFASSSLGQPLIRRRAMSVIRIETQVKKTSQLRDISRVLHINTGFSLLAKSRPRTPALRFPISLIALGKLNLHDIISSQISPTSASTRFVIAISSHTVYNIRLDWEESRDGGKESIRMVCAVGCAPPGALHLSSGFSWRDHADLIPIPVVRNAATNM